MEPNTAILIAILLPALATLANVILRDQPNLRDGTTLVAAIATFLVVLSILGQVGNGTTETVVSAT